MALQFDNEVKNNMLDGFEAGVGASPVLEIWSGTKPANTGAVDAADGAVLASMDLPADFMANAASGQKTLSGAWQDLSANATGTATHFRIKANGGTPVRVQGDVGTSGSDLNLSSVSLTAGQSVTINTFTLNMNNN